MSRFLNSRGGELPEVFPLKSSRFRIHDYDFDDILWKAWNLDPANKSKDLSIVLLEICRDWNEEWNSHCAATVVQRGTTKSHEIEHGSPAAKWLSRFQKVPCLPDQYGHFYRPDKLYRTTPSTASLQGLEKFLHPNYDKPEYHEFLDQLGVRSKPVNVEGVVKRIRVLSQTEPPLWSIY